MLKSTMIIDTMIRKSFIELETSIHLGFVPSKLHKTMATKIQSGST
jgi:hypothetical protein